MKPKFRKLQSSRRTGMPRLRQKRRSTRWPLRNRPYGTTNRTYEDYMSEFWPCIRKGTRVLDLGSGYSDFVGEARKKGIDVVGVDWQFSKREWYGRGAPLESARHSIAAIAQELPFRSNSFDTVLCNVGPLFHEKGKAQRQAFFESLRVLKKGGVLAVSDLEWRDSYILDNLKKAGFGVKRTWRIMTIKKTNPESLNKLKKIWGIK